MRNCLYEINYENVLLKEQCHFFNICNTSLASEKRIDKNYFIFLLGLEKRSCFLSQYLPFLSLNQYFPTLNVRKKWSYSTFCASFFSHVKQQTSLNLQNWVKTYIYNLCLQNICAREHS